MDSKHTLRRGATAVEFALVAPLLFLTVFASIEFSRAYMLRQTNQVAAAEGARRGVVPGAIAADCVAVAQKELAVIGARGSTIDVTPRVLDEDTPEVTVTVKTPYAGNSYLPGALFGTRAVESRVTFKRN